VDFWKSLYKKHADPSFKKQLKGVLGYTPGNFDLLFYHPEQRAGVSPA
jgi:hypothetical protein